jgi:hypothetical protein
MYHLLQIKKRNVSICSQSVFKISYDSHNNGYFPTQHYVLHFVMEREYVFCMLKTEFLYSLHSNPLVIKSPSIQNAHTISTLFREKFNIFIKLLQKQSCDAHVFMYFSQPSLIALPIILSQAGAVRVDVTLTCDHIIVYLKLVTRLFPVTL